MSNIYLSKAAFVSKEQLYLTMGHEYMHAGFGYSYSKMTTDQEHAAIYKWQYIQKKYWRMNYKYDKMMYRRLIKQFKYNYSHVGFRILKTKSW